MTVAKILGFIAVYLLFALTSSAQIIDGMRDATYGAPVSVQNTPTSFGDDTDPSASTATGSELDALYFRLVPGNVVNLLLTGNLETNGNRIYIFLDTKPGGQNTLAGQAGRFGDLDGMQFDIGFNPDYALTINSDNDASFFDFGDLQALTTRFLGSTTNGTSGGALDQGVSGVLNNFNVAGVSGTSGSGGELVTTGLELQIPLILIGSPTGFTMMAIITGNSMNPVVSNQVLAPIGGTTATNIGNANTVDFSAVAGVQFVAIPEPSTISLLAASVIFGGCFYARRRNR